MATVAHAKAIVPILQLCVHAVLTWGCLLAIRHQFVLMGASNISIYLYIDQEIQKTITIWNGWQWGFVVLALGFCGFRF